MSEWLTIPQWAWLGDGPLVLAAFPALERFDQWVGLISKAIGYITLALAVIWALTSLSTSNRLLRTTLYHDRGIAIALCKSAWKLLRWWIVVKNPKLLREVAKVLIEVDILYPPPARPGVLDPLEDWKKYRVNRRAWRKEVRDILQVSMHDLGGKDRPVLSVGSFFELSDDQVEMKLERYFDNLQQIRHPDPADANRFYCVVEIQSGFVAPQHLVAGLLSHFKDEWKPVIDDYNRAVVPPPTAPPDRVPSPLRRLQVFQFDCWLMWGPSIPACECWSSRPKSSVAFQYGYGDELNSIPLYATDGRLEDELRKGFQALANKGGPIPWSFPLAVRAIPRCGKHLGDSVTFGTSQESIASANVVLEFKEHVAALNVHSASMYQAYVWDMFVICNQQGEPLYPLDSSRKDLNTPWKGMLPFFTHTNIADGHTFEFHKEELARKSLDSLRQILATEGCGDLTFRFVCAVDDSGCGRPLRFPIDRSSILDHLLKMRAAAPQPLQDRVLLPGTPEYGSFYAAPYSACNLPMIVEPFYRSMESAS